MWNICKCYCIRGKKEVNIFKVFKFLHTLAVKIYGLYTNMG